MAPNAGPLPTSDTLGHARSEATLEPEELTRFSRHLLLPEVGERGQHRLKEARVLIVGAGGLGSPAALYLAAAGVGTIGLVDPDRVDLTNLQRQLLYETDDLGLPKTAAATRRLRGLNPGVSVVPFETALTSRNALEIFGSFDVIIDGTDNFATRYLISDACVLSGKPDVYGSVLRFEGQATVLAAPDGPCYRCLYPAPPPAGTVPGCAEAGVLGVLPGLIGVIQATEALKLLLGVGDTLVRRLLLADALRMAFHTVRVRRDPRCVACGTRTLTELQDYAVLCGTPATVVPSLGELTPSELAGLLARQPAPVLIDVREPWEWGIVHLPGARLVPLSHLDQLLPTLDPERATVVYCHHGVRSIAAAERLLQAGFSQVWHLAGGIDRWREEIDRDMPGY